MGNVFDYLLSGGSLDISKRHSLGIFDSSNCGVYNGGGATGEMCCGTYPERGMHRVLGDIDSKECCGRHLITVTDTKACCDNLNVYDASTRECCNTGWGTNRLIGDC